MSEKLPIVLYTFRGISQQTGRRDTGFGYLLNRNDEYWCLPDENWAELQVFPTGAFQIDLSQLQEQPRRGFDRKLYHYLREVETDQQGNPSPPPRSPGGQQQVY
ncbi:MAG: hypothetical protein ACLPKB_35840 [Xanthobacteraceae bacterium]